MFKKLIFVMSLICFYLPGTGADADTLPTDTTSMTAGNLSTLNDTSSREPDGSLQSDNVPLLSQERISEDGYTIGLTQGTVVEGSGLYGTDLTGLSVYIVPGSSSLTQGEEQSIGIQGQDEYVRYFDRKRLFLEVLKAGRQAGFTMPNVEDSGVKLLVSCDKIYEYARMKENTSYVFMIGYDEDKKALFTQADDYEVQQYVKGDRSGVFKLYSADKDDLFVEDSIILDDREYTIIREYLTMGRIFFVAQPVNDNGDDETPGYTLVEFCNINDLGSRDNSLRVMIISNDGTGQQKFIDSADDMITEGMPLPVNFAPGYE